jgi:hypothetical protein
MESSGPGGKSEDKITGSRKYENVYKCVLGAEMQLS